MTEVRGVREILAARPTVEGAGVHLKRAFGYAQVPLFDPFLMLDDFHSARPADYLAGFPWHPHRGIETITYVLHGRMAHADSMGHSGVIGPGDVQWMTAGSGVIHQEMPVDPGTYAGEERGGAGEEGADPRLLWGLQLWANLPAASKMMAPRYQNVPSGQIPRVTLEGGVTVRVVCGEVDGARGPVTDIVIDPVYLDVSLPAGSRFVRRPPAEHTAFVYVLDGQVALGEPGTMVANERVALLGSGDSVLAAAPEAPARLLFVSGRPLHEPVAWGGPIVMNTEEELLRAMTEYRDGSFVRAGDRAG